jgi:hypothetical protein
MYIIYKRERGAYIGLALLLVLMSFVSHFSQPVPIAKHRPMGHDLLHRPMHGDWHVLAEKAA